MFSAAELTIIDCFLAVKIAQAEQTIASLTSDGHPALEKWAANSRGYWRAVVAGLKWAKEKANVRMPMDDSLVTGPRHRKPLL